MKSFKDYKDNTNEDEVAKLERELQDKILGRESEEKEQLTNKIEQRRLGSESVENHLEAQEYTRQVLDQLEQFEKERLSRAIPKAPEKSTVEGVSDEELQRLKNESSNVFASKGAPAHTPGQTFAQVKQEATTEELDRTVALDPRKVGAEALLKDIAKSEVDSSQGIRDFYNHVYSKEGEKRLRDKEAYLSLPLTGDVQKARKEVDRFSNLNGYNSSSLAHLNDGLITAMNEQHKQELDSTPQGTTRDALEKRHAVEKRHEVEKALFAFREHSDLHGQDDTPTAAQERKNAFGTLQRSHIAYAENRWGRPLAHKDTPNVNDEVEKFDLKQAAPKPTSKPTDLQAYMEAKAEQKNKLTMKISKFR